MVPEGPPFLTVILAVDVRLQNGKITPATIFAVGKVTVRVAVVTGTPIVPAVLQTFDLVSNLRFAVEVSTDAVEEATIEVAVSAKF